MNDTVPKYQRILSNGSIVALDRKKYFVASDKIIDQEIMSGQHINVWGKYINLYKRFLRK